MPIARKLTSFLPQVSSSTDPPTPQAPIRLAILECDTPLAPLLEKYGTFGNQFEILLDAGARAMGREDLTKEGGGLEITKWDVVDRMEYPELGDVDAILMTGSKYNAFDDTPWIKKLVEFTKSASETDRIRIIGVCFGHQILGRALGAKVGRNDLAWEVAVNDINLTPRGKEVFGQETLSLHQMHRDIVFNYPPGVEELGSSPVCNVQGMYSPKKLISVQGHPEFNQDVLEQIIKFRHSQGIFDDVQYEDGMKKVGLHHDGVVVSQAFLRFLVED